MKRILVLLTLCCACALQTNNKKYMRQARKIDQIHKHELKNYFFNHLPENKKACHQKTRRPAHHKNGSDAQQIPVAALLPLLAALTIEPHS